MKPYYDEDGITLYHGKAEHVLPELPERSFVVITDPPYLTSETGVPVRGGGVGKRIEESNGVGMPWGYSLDWITDVAELGPLHWVIYCNYRMLGGVQSSVEKYAKLSCTFIWRKNNAPQMTRPVPRLDCEFILWLRAKRADCARMGLFKSMVLDVPMPQAGCMADERLIESGSLKALHPCQKPIAVVAPFVERLAVNGETVLDPFAGTGTMLVAAKQSGVPAIGIEQDGRYCEAIINRLKQGILKFGGAA